MLDTASFPNFEIAHYVDYDADSGARGVKEEETGESSHREATSATELDVARDEEMTRTPSEAEALVRGHRPPDLFAIGDRERRG